MAMRKICLILAAAILTGPLMVAASVPAAAQGGWAQRCYDLWYQRNSIYAAKGYCFRTAQARSVFGPGCFPPYGRLTNWEKRQVAAIQAEEGRLGCRY